MHSRTVEQVRSWDSRPFDGGLAALSALSEDGHTGAVTAGHTWLFMLNGRVIGVFEGEIEDFEASGTVYATSEDGLPLLFAMQERGGRTRAKYFTEDTSLQEADQTLSSANFTGYVELSENVLSGDYYLVYYGGTRREVAFVGQSERVETGEDAYDLAADEVGLYEVKDVSLTITEIPEPASREPQAAAAAMSDPSDEDSASVTEAQSDANASPGADQSATESASTETSRTPSAGPAEAASPGAESKASKATPAAERESATADQQAAARTAPPEAPEPDADEQQSADDSRRDRQQRRADAAQQQSAPRDQQSASEDAESEAAAGGTKATADETATSDAASTAELERRFQEEAEWRQTRAIPALDPEDTHPTDGEVEESSATEPAQTRQAAEPPSTHSKSSTGQQAPRSTLEKLQAAVEKREQRIDELQTQIQSLESDRSELEAALEDAQSARESLESDLETLREERDDLAARVEELEAGAEVGQSSETLSPEAALAGTNLFVRYDSKGEPTLEALGEADPAAIDANLRLEHHTQFETDAVTVDGKPYRAFLESTGTFAVLSWLLREFPYELLETDNRTAMAELFEAISAIDRIELDGAVSVDAEAGQTETFSFVLRDRMGNPLIVGDYDDSRDAVRESKLQNLLSGAEAVAGVGDQFAGALYVTKSFFEPDALELAENSASSGGLFSRGEKASYVSPADGTGFHLALVEDRSQTFHVTVPKL
jgi:hypothetical protein